MLKTEEKNTKLRKAISNSDIDNPYKDEFQILTSIKKSIVLYFLFIKPLTPNRLKQDLNVGHSGIWDIDF